MQLALLTSRDPIVERPLANIALELVSCRRHDTKVLMSLASMVLDPCGTVFLNVAEIIIVDVSVVLVVITEPQDLIV